MSKLVRLGVVFVAMVSAGTPIALAKTPATPAVLAQASPAPKSKATPNPFSYGGYIRAYYFTRTNPPGVINQATYNQAVNLHAAYDFGGHLSVGGTYLYADPFNGCGDPASHYFGTGPCRVKVLPHTGPYPTTWDDTLPGFRLSTLYEAYLQYKDPALYAKLGDQVINTPWANSSDGRLKPVAFQGGDLTDTFSKNWNGEIMYMDRWENRVQSDFVDSTLITNNGAYPDSPGVGNTGIPRGTVVANNGFGYGRLGFAAGALKANLHYYAFNNIANAIWFDGTYGWKAPAKPFLAVQLGSETETGSALAGKVDSQIFGIQGGISPWKNVSFSVGADFIPVKSNTITLPATAVCMPNGSIAGTLMYWLPAGGTPNCTTAAPGVKGAVATVYYGGWASPYTDAYATDPLFTTSISQGMADRRSPGSSVKLAGTFFTDNKQVRLIASHAWYVYGSSGAGLSPTQETDFDVTYFFSKVGTGAYHGWSIRHRYAERSQAHTALFGGFPDFKYNRTQLEYDF
ncbi:MAG: hypothetical protein ACYDDQ_00230 [Vulcanimicrobiaceae bacterium]